MKSFLVALLLVSGFVLDWMKAYLVYSPQNERLFTLPFCLEADESFDSSLEKQKKDLHVLRCPVFTENIDEERKKKGFRSP